MNELRLDTGLWEPGSRILCAVSGGADSVCLLALMRAGAGTGILCAHFNHRLRGEESDRDEAFVRELCRSWGIPFFSGSGDVSARAESRGESVEEAARALRYAFLERTAAEQGADYIATAHTLSDNAETVLLNLARGSGLRGLCGIPPRRGKIIRPMLGIRREQVEEYLREREIPWVEDSTNRSDDYARNRVRHHLLPLLENIHGGAAENIARAALSLREDEEYLSGEAEKFLRACPGDGVPVGALLALPRPVQSRVLGMAAGGGLSREHREMLLELCRSEKPSGACSLPGLTAYREYDRLCFGEKNSGSLPERILIPGEPLALPEAGLRIYSKISSNHDEIQKSFNTFYFSCDSIYGKISVASRREGDSVRPVGGNGTKSVKKWMIGKKIPRRDRMLIPVLRDEAGVLAVYGLGPAERTAPAPGKPFIKIEIQEMREETKND